MAQGSILSPAIESVIAELEIQRKKIASTQIKGWGFIILGAVCFSIGCILSAIIAVIIGFAIFIPGAILLYRISDDTKIYKNRFKQEVVGAALKAVDQSLSFEPENGISETEFINSQLFSTSPDRYHTEDLISGKDEKTSFCFAEVHAEYKTETQTKNGRRVQWHDILKGIIFIADFNKNFNGTTVVRPKDFGSSLGAWFSKNVYSFSEKELVELENDYFNKNFVTHSTDQIEARYILTPAMMEKISELNDRSAYCVSLSFISSSVYIAFPLDSNYFEPPVFKTLLKPDLLSEDMNILNLMFGFIKELDLNTRIWTKQ
jgi:TM2 domain-containing membrane protein YozV